MQGMAQSVPLSRVGVPDVYNFAARHLQLIRSIPSKSLKSVCIGMKQRDHVHANLELIQKALMTREQFFGALKPFRRTEFIEEDFDY
eukprot:CAMPEP_0176354396 /NCGR_PEP_ID=MMETSP0126-20121128/12529_1 /TAXON_ID=141414 ORGANISM="Strombidinopsis acuminatum, Strain SPMC142" /NCGR_SAMPLE_ID=MMETSP0126 /ASSEMBLY_ACC=CAM_ASM_000229 /LENGTH=86 /DNA_ID=CAMNT_0017706557 /DNA_START=1176 /DNA_END=1436 /DNA_ORIENTATION=+